MADPDTDRAEKAVDTAAVIQRELTRRLRPFAITYALVSLPQLLKIVGSKGPAIQRLERVLRALLKPTTSTLKLSAFPAVLPFIYQTLLPLVRKYGPNTAYTSELTALLVSPVSLLLPHGLRVYLALYAVTSAMTTFLKSASPKDQARKIAEGRAGEKEWRDYLPPVTVLNALGNSWMKWSWYNEKGVFPKSYEKLIIDHSPHYVPRSRPPYEIRDFLETTLNPPVPNPVPGGHHWLVCQTQHPDEPSCTVNYLKAWIDGAPEVAKWVASFGALSTLLSFKKRILSEPVSAVRDWLDYTIRGVLYVNGSVQTVWAVTCVLQRVFPSNFMPKNRWLINGSVASLWIYALPAKRQSEISIYVGRIAALSVWRAWRKHGGGYIPHGELLLLALGWGSLLQLREKGWRIEGLMRRGILFIEGDEKVLERTKAGWSPDISRVGSSEDIKLKQAASSSPGEGSDDVEVERNPKTSRSVDSFASTMSTVSDSGFSSEEDDDYTGSKGERGDIRIESRLGTTPGNE